jgi:hypothetical protein
LFTTATAKGSRASGKSARVTVTVTGGRVSGRWALADSRAITAL